MFRFIACTTNTSFPSGSKFKSTEASVKVFAAVCVAVKPMATVLDWDLSPAGIPIMIGTKSIIHTITVLEHLYLRIGNSRA